MCVKCHKGAYEGFSLTKHAVRGDPRTPSGTGRECQACHGDASEHLKNPAKNPMPQRFLKTQGPADAQNQVCLTCHQGGKRIHWQSSTHATRDVTCTSCHQVHTAHDRARDKLDAGRDVLHLPQGAARPDQPALRATRSARAWWRAPTATTRTASAGPSMMVRDNVNDTCYTCHMEKRGPFVRTHQPVQENCAICHNPHGTTIAEPAEGALAVPVPAVPRADQPSRQRRRRSPATEHRREHGVAARGCLNCHTNIHGTNNPASSPTNAPSGADPG